MCRCVCVRACARVCACVRVCACMGKRTPAAPLLLGTLEWSFHRSRSRARPNSPPANILRDKTGRISRSVRGKTSFVTMPLRYHAKRPFHALRYQHTSTTHIRLLLLSSTSPPTSGRISRSTASRTSRTMQCHHTPAASRTELN